MPREKKRPVKAPSKPQDSDQGTADLPVRAKDDEVTLNVPSGKGSITVFDDDYDEHGSSVAPAAISTESTQRPSVAVDEDSDDDSDDDAPEAVSTQAAASVAKSSSLIAYKAAQEQASAQKRKRKERDTRLKQQAQQRQASKVEQKLAVEGDSEEGSGEEEEERGVGGEEDFGDEQAMSSSVSGRRLRPATQAVNLLPAEFLTDSSSESEDEGQGGGADRSSSRPKRRRVAGVERRLTRDARGPRDQVVGSTLYRVAGKRDERLAPKAAKAARNTKDLLQRRNRAPVAPRGGFFKR